MSNEGFIGDASKRDVRLTRTIGELRYHRVGDAWYSTSTGQRLVDPAATFELAQIQLRESRRREAERAEEERVRQEASRKASTDEQYAFRRALASEQEARDDRSQKRTAVAILIALTLLVIWGTSYASGQRASDFENRPAVFQDCEEARAYGVGTVYKGERGYGTHLDRDGDGAGCEPWP